MTIIGHLQKNIISKIIIYNAGKNRAENMVNIFKPFLNKKDKIIDIGAGVCNICEVLQKNKYRVIPIDVTNLSFIKNIKPLIYDGKKIPFKANTFDKALILTVLHHVRHPEKIIQEAKRVAKEIIIVEDIYSNWFHKYLTYFFDSLLNLEFIGHPHSNKSDREWQKTFKKLGLKLIDVKYNQSFLIFKHATYYLKK